MTQLHIAGSPSLPPRNMSCHNRTGTAKSSKSRSKEASSFSDCSMVNDILSEPQITSSGGHFGLDAEREYAVGRIVHLAAAEDSETLCSLRVVEQKKVGKGRTCQVVVGNLLEGTLRGGKNNLSVISEDSNIVAKFYDPDFARSDRRMESDSDSILLCKSSKTAETHSYKKLRDLQGADIPEFYGEYVFTRATMGQLTTVSVILLQFIPDTLVVQMLPIPLETASRIRKLALEIREKLHSRGVCHGDMEVWNWLWNSTTEKLTLIDFECATFDDWDYNPSPDKEESRNNNIKFMEDRKRDDLLILKDMFRELGLVAPSLEDVNFLMPNVVIG